MKAINEQVGKTLKRARQNKGWTMNDVEEITVGEFKAAILGAYERGHRAVSVSRLFALSKLYDISMIELLGLQNEAATYAQIAALENQIEQIKAGNHDAQM